MTSPARKYRLAACAHQANSNELDLNQLTEYQRLVHQLKQDKAVLKNLASIQDKIIAKAQMLPHYADWISGCLQADNAPSDDLIVATVLIWQIDCGQINEAMPLVRFALKHELASPDEYARSLPEVIVEEIADQISKGAEIEAEYLGELLQYATAKRENGQHVHNMPDEIRAKLLKVAGEIADQQGDSETALAYFQAALQYNERIGVKQRIAQLEKQSA